MICNVYTEVDASLIPTGRVVGVQGTPLDLTKPTRLGEVVIGPTDFPAVFFTFFPFDICHEAQTTDRYKRIKKNSVKSRAIN